MQRREQRLGRGPSTARGGSLRWPPCFAQDDRVIANDRAMALISALACGFGLAFYFRSPLNSYAGDAVAFQFVHGETAAFVFEGVAKHRDTLQAGEDESSQGLESGV